MTAIQIILVALFAFVAIRVIVRYFRRKTGFRSMVFWLVFWLAGLALALFPDLTFYFAKKLGVGRGADLVVYAALVILFLFAYRLTVKTEKMSDEITALSRKMALTEKDK